MRTTNFACVAPPGASAGSGTVLMNQSIKNGITKVEKIVNF